MGVLSEAGCDNDRVQVGWPTLCLDGITVTSVTFTWQSSAHLVFAQRTRTVDIKQYKIILSEQRLCACARDSNAAPTSLWRD